MKRQRGSLAASLILTTVVVLFSACDFDETEGPRDGFDRNVRARVVNDQVEVFLPAYTVGTVTYNGQATTVNALGVATFNYVQGVNTMQVSVDVDGGKENKVVVAVNA